MNLFFYQGTWSLDEDDPFKITNIVEWRSAAIEPAFKLTAETPNFAKETTTGRKLRHGTGDV